MTKIITFSTPCRCPYGYQRYDRYECKLKNHAPCITCGPGSCKNCNPPKHCPIPEADAAFPGIRYGAKYDIDEKDQND